MKENVLSTLSKTVLGAMIFLACCGFDFSKHSIPVEEISDGGPGKDGIPALLSPKFMSSREADEEFLKSGDRVLGLAVNGDARAYPIKILNWHEIVNDTVGGRPVVVTFCPLCGTGMVFDSEIGGRKMTFGVSGLLYQSDVLLYDHQTESLWSQIKTEAVTGPMTGTRLNLVASTHTTWENWKKRYPRTRVLSDDTGYRRNYQRDPYAGYEKSPRLMFGVDKVSDAFHPKERVIGLEIGGAFKAYPFSELATAKQPVKDKVNGVPVSVFYDRKSKSAVIRDKDGKEIPTVAGFWFAWYTFHPDTQVFKENKR